MLIPRNNILENKHTFIFVFINKISSKNMQDLIFFLQKNDFILEQLNKKNNKQKLTSIFVNANYILKSTQKIRSDQLKKIIVFVNQYSQINGIFFENQILNFERIARLKEHSLFILWKKINNFLF